MKNSLKQGAMLSICAVALYAVVTTISATIAAPATRTGCGYGYSDTLGFGYGTYSFGYGTCTTASTPGAGGSSAGSSSTTTVTTTNGVTTTTTTTKDGVVTTTTAPANSCNADVPAHVAMRTPKLENVGATVYGKFSGRFVKYNNMLKKSFAMLSTMETSAKVSKINAILGKILCIKPTLTGDAKILVQFVEDNLVMLLK